MSRRLLGRVSAAAGCAFGVGVGERRLKSGGGPIGVAQPLMQRDDSAHERRGRGKRAKAVQGAQHGRGVLSEEGEKVVDGRRVSIAASPRYTRVHAGATTHLRIELQLRECQRRPRVAPCIGDDGSLAQRRLRIGGPLGTSGQRRRDDSGCLRECAAGVG
eukprot:scaffold325822_cov57-Tisochrysis_lutea.AAC.3